MPNQPLGCREQIIETDAEPNLLDHLVCVFGIDVVFYCLTCFFVEVFRVDLDKVRNFGLESVRYSLEKNTSLVPTRMNMTGSVVSRLALNNTVEDFDARRLSRIQLTRI
jgi:hypothetical protein